MKKNGKRIATILCVAVIVAVVLVIGLSLLGQGVNPPAKPNAPSSSAMVSGTGEQTKATDPADPIGGEHTHSYEADVTEPTCMDGGHMTYTCSICGSSYTDSEVPALGHTWGEWVVAEEPTVDSTGLKTRTCAVCGEMEEAVMDKVPDTSQHDHEYATRVVLPTCSAGGYTWHECKCGASYQDDVTEPLGHDYVRSVTDPTCEKEGYTTYTCSICGDSYKGDVVKATGHDYESTVSKPTCEKDGFTTHTCKTCGDTYKDTKVKAKGHNWGDWRTVKEATCSKEGKRERVCNACDKLETKKIAATGHDYQETVVDATCTEDGSSSRICMVCGDKKTTVISAGHDWSDWKVTKEATEGEEGERSRTCTACGKNETEKINKAEHKHSWKTTVVPQKGCTGLGYTLWECLTCGYSIKLDCVASPGHDWSDWQATKEAEVGVPGEEQRTCKECGEVETVATPPLEDDGRKYENYIDPRVEVEEGFTSRAIYTYGNIRIYDKRNDRGTDPSIRVNDDNSLTVSYYNLNGELVEINVFQAPEGYTRSLVINKDGTYSIGLTGDPS